jgi:hypothetical protein
VPEISRSLPQKGRWRSADYAAHLGISLRAFACLKSRDPARLAAPLPLPGVPQWRPEDVYSFEAALAAQAAAAATRTALRRGPRSTAAKAAAHAAAAAQPERGVA